MKQLLLCLLLVFPAGCASHSSADRGPEAFCRRQANNDPDVVRLTMKNLTIGGRYDNLNPAINLARHRALQRCLRERGIAVRGGVEPLAPQ
jgi:hypothetical protein